MLILNMSKKKYDKNGNQMLVLNLEKLGLSEKEARVYLYLIERTVDVGTSKIITGTGLHGQYVYLVLESLQNKGLVKHVVKNNRNKWSANPPARIGSLIEEKRVLANTVQDALEKLFARPDAQEFEVYQGEEQLVAAAFQMIESAMPNSTLSVIGGEGSRFSEMLGEERRPYNKIGLDKNVTIRYIGTEAEKEYLTWVKNRRELFDYRIMPGFKKSTVSTSIYPHAILLQIYGDPILVFKIKSEQVAQDYQLFFESLWDLCGTH